MPRVDGIRQKQHQPIWDTLVRVNATPSPVIAATSQLFGSANVGQLQLTNMQTAGQLASDQVYNVLALRCWMFFDSSTASQRRGLYLRTSSQLYFTLVTGDKPQFQAPAWYFPAGGGVYGFDSAASVLNNGMPSQEAILKLAKPIHIPVRQNIAVTCQFFNVGTDNVLGTTAGDINANSTDSRVIMFMIDGVRTRDVE